MRCFVVVAAPNSSFGWYDETTAFDSVDVPQSNKACYQIEDWRNLETWDGGRERRRESHDVRLRERLFVGGSARTFQSWGILSSWQKEEVCGFVFVYQGEGEKESIEGDDVSALIVGDVMAEGRQGRVNG